MQQGMQKSRAEENQAGGNTVKLLSATAIVVAAGKSRRMGFDKLAGRLAGGDTVLARSVYAFDRHPQIAELVLVAGDTNRAICEALAEQCKKPARVVQGGTTRAASVRAGVQAARQSLIAIHDAARPFVTEEIITQALEQAARTGAAAPAVAVKDTIKQVYRSTAELSQKADDPAGLTICATPDREALYAVQTPQCFLRERYLQALDKLKGTDALDQVTDDCSLLELAGFPVVLTPGSYANRKITTMEDWKGETQMRIGHGYDVHKLVQGRRLILGGVEIPYEKGLLGHSDADVLLHAVMDALLGAAALGDIGQHFPDTDPAYAGADSMQLLQEVAKLLRQDGRIVGNIDATILCQAPKLAPHIPAMRQNMAQALGIALSQVSVKATTEEHLGFTGEGLGIAAHAVALLEN